MDIIKLIFKNNTKKILLLMLIGLIGGGAHLLLLVCINKNLTDIINGEKLNFSLLIIFPLLIIYLLFNKMSLNMTLKSSLKMVSCFRMDLIRSFLTIPFTDMKFIKESFYSIITKDTFVISHAILSLIRLLISVVSVIGCLIYIVYLSFSMFIFVLIVVLVGVGLYVYLSRYYYQHLRNSKKYEDELGIYIRQVIDGFKEVKVNMDKGYDLINGPFAKCSNLNINSVQLGLRGFQNNNIINQTLIYGSLVLLIIVGNHFFNLPLAVLVNCIIILLFLIGPLEAGVTMIPLLSEANIAATRISKFINAHNERNQNCSVSSTLYDNFKSIKFEKIECSYNDVSKRGDTIFKLGPIDFNIEKNKIIFIHGNNGSGKTTLLYAILGLLKISDGRLYVNNINIVYDANFQSLFAPVFNDCHLFDSFYGIKSIDRNKANYLLGLFELQEKVVIENNQFNTVELSTGQKKRLALILAILENRKIIVLDEWAADQSPYFRHKFYTIILPKLKCLGFTIVAVTHDDKYYYASDVLYYMNDGRLNIEIPKNIE